MTCPLLLMFRLQVTSDDALRLLSTAYGGGYCCMLQLNFVQLFAGSGENNHAADEPPPYSNPYE